jgi:serine/threonine protein kinase
MTNHLIPLQLTYKYGENYFLIFPWADGNLKAFWASQDPDCQREERVWWFFEQCVGITFGLRKIHHLGTLPKDNLGTNKLDVKVLPKRVLNDDKWGRHNDIKPENILWFKEFDEKKDHLVISDFGLTRFNSARSKSIAPADQIQGFSATYKPPDLHFNDGISQTYDVWSLGCVFLEFVSWFLLGGKSIDDFEHARLHDKLESQGEVPEDKFFALVPAAKQRQTAVLKQSVVKVR